MTRQRVESTREARETNAPESRRELVVSTVSTGPESIASCSGRRDSVVVEMGDASGKTRGEKSRKRRAGEIEEERSKTHAGCL